MTSDRSTALLFGASFTRKWPKLMTGQYSPAPISQMTPSTWVCGTLNRFLDRHRAQQTETKPTLFPSWSCGSKCTWYSRFVRCNPASGAHDRDLERRRQRWSSRDTVQLLVAGNFEESTITAECCECRDGGERIARLKQMHPQHRSKKGNPARLDLVVKLLRQLLPYGHGEEALSEAL